MAETVTSVQNAHRLIESGDRLRAVAELERAAAAGDPASLLELAVWYLEGRHVPRDLRRSRELFRRSAELGETVAERVYICFLANGVGGEADWQAAKDRLGRLAQSDSLAACQIERVEAMRLSSDGYPTSKPDGRRISSSPDAFAFDEFFSRAECEYLVALSEPLLRQSVVVDPVTGRMQPHPVRTSDGAMFPWVSEDLVVSAFNRRIAVASGTDFRCGEPLQVLRYRPGQEYRPHLDALPSGDNQRVLTMLVYLNEDYRGGETLFTRTQLQFSGGLGSGLLFRNAQPGGLPDEQAQHAGLPVLEGEKYIASRWIRERPLVAS